MRRIFNYTFRHSNFVIVSTIIITLFFSYHALHIKIDPSAENLVPKHSKVIEMLDKHKADPELTAYFLFAVESDDLFTIEGLQALEQAIAEVEKLPGIGSGVNPFKVLTFAKDNGRLSVFPLAPGGHAPQTRDELEQFRTNLIGNPFYSGKLISEDGTLLCAGFPCRPLTDEASGFMADYNEIKTGLEKYFTVYTTGDVPISDRCNTYLINDLGKLISLAFIFMLISFYLGFRSKRSFLLPMSVVIMGTLWTLGLMSLLGFRLNMISLIIPPLVLTIGSSYAIHLLNQYYREARPDGDDKIWIIDATIHVNKTIIFACLTTVIGFISLLFTPLSQTREFGISTSFGIFTCMVLTIFYMPAVLSKTPSPSARQKDRINSGLFSKMMGRLGLWVYRFRVSMLVIMIIITIVFIYSYPRIPSQSDYLSYFPDGDSVVRETIHITSKTGGYQVLNLTLSSPDNEAGYFLKPEVLERISSFELEMLEDNDVRSVISVPFFIRELNFIMTGKNEIPEQNGLINLLSRYLKLLRTEKGSHNEFRKITNNDYSQITLSFNIYNSKKNLGLSEEALRKLISRFEIKNNADLEDLNPELWSSDFRFLYLADLLNSGQAISTIIAIVMVFIISWIIFRSIKYALLTLLPLFAGLMLNFTLMAILQIPLDMLTLMVSSIVIGVGVDNAIHYNIRFRKNFAAIGSVKKSIELTHRETGRPIFHTTISIVGGLLFLLLSNFLGIAYFGLLICFALTFAMLGTLVILPAIIGLTVKDNQKKA